MTLGALKVFAFGCFENHGVASKTLIIQKQTESCQADFSSADVFMAVHSGTEWALGVIQVKEVYSFKADDLVKT